MFDCFFCFLYNYIKLIGGKVHKKLNFLLEVGSSKLVLVATVKGKHESKIVDQATVLYDGFMDGEFLSPDDLELNLSELIATMSSKLRANIHSISVGVPSEFCMCVCKRISRKFVEPHKITNHDIANLFEANASFGDSNEYSVINFSPMQYMLDDSAVTMQPVGKRTSSLVVDASFVLAKNSFIKFLTAKLNKLGVNNVDFIWQALGQAIKCAQDMEAKQPIAVVDVGHITTSVAVLKGEGLALLSSFSMGGGHISSDIMQLLGMNFKDAELIKRKIILTIESERNEYYEVKLHDSCIKAPISMTNQIVKSRIEMLAKVIGEILGIDPVFKNYDLYLTGDGIANFKGVKTILKQQTGMDVHIYQNQFDTSKNKLQTSIQGLITLNDMLV